MLTIRDATLDDVPALERVQALGGAGHHDRIAFGAPFRVLVATDDGDVIGYAFLALAAPPFWQPRFVPQLVDLQVRPDRRGQGAGTALVHAAEAAARDHGDPALYLAVDPDDNPRARALYRRLGFHVLDPHPVDEPWRFTDSSGYEHSGVDHVVYMRKDVG
jgi:GNAT superfamily N-acetyltransferase